MRNFLEEFHAIFLYRDKFKCSFLEFLLIIIFSEKKLSSSTLIKEETQTNSKSSPTHTIFLLIHRKGNSTISMVRKAFKLEAHLVAVVSIFSICSEENNHRALEKESQD